MKATFRKGIHPDGRKDVTKDIAFEVMEPGDKVYIPVSQHIGAPCTPTVNKGDRVKAGTLVAVSNGFVSANIFSSVSGEVDGFVFRECVLGQKIRHIVIKNDGLYEEQNLPVLEQPEGKEIVNRVKEAGIVGMGGAAFPTHVKLSPKTAIKTLILNGAECEPYITADYRLMLERPAEIIEG
ncbi:MAG: electron transporter RnfC, partial [Clostridia bacterium]|nr:electron transporter RnfC [Clostridia bacterium]